MNTLTARLVANKLAELIEFSSIFHTRYGTDYRVGGGSPLAAWQLYQNVIDQQTLIATMLDPQALESPLSRFANWWKRQDVIDAGIASQLAQEAFHLIACCATYETDPRGEPSPAILCSQRVIAGTLHPSCLLVAQSQTPQVLKAS